MIDENETYSAILAEMRKAVVPMICGRPKIEAVTIRDVLRWADRIEAAVKREMDEAAEFIDDYLREIPVYRPPHDWLIRNGYKDTSYQNDIFEDQNDGAAPVPDGAERGANGDTK
jgi:hypothetical protein